MLGVRIAAAEGQAKILLRGMHQKAQKEAQRNGGFCVIRYQCNYCDVGFDVPTVVTYKEYLGENMTRLYKDERCPICGCDSFRDVGECAKCGDAAEVGDILCKQCKRSLKKRLIEFFDTLTTEEEEQFDEWMDGDTITNRRGWN